MKGVSKVLKRKLGSGRAGSPVHEDSVDAMVLMMRAARLSEHLCSESCARIYFQLYGEVKHKARESGWVRNILGEIERCV